MKSTCQTYYRPVLVGVPVDKPERYLYQPRCKMWKCLYCGHVNKLQWRERVQQGVNYYHEHGVKSWSFVTITMSGKTRGFEYSVSIWPKRWPKLSTRIRRLAPGIKYVLLPERHKDGTLHTHAIMGAEITTTWISKNAHTCGLGFKSEAEPMKDLEKASFYLSKYVTKTIGVEDWPKGLRRVRTSQKWPALIDDDDFGRYDVDWHYLSTYPTDGLDYLASELTAKNGVKYKVI